METTIEQESQTTLPQLLDRVSAGERITITRHGVPVAEIGPPEVQSKRSVGELIAAMDRIAERNRLGGLSLREMMEEGRD